MEISEKFLFATKSITDNMFSFVRTKRVALFMRGPWLKIHREKAGGHTSTIGQTSMRQCNIYENDWNVGNMAIGKEGGKNRRLRGYGMTYVPVENPAIRSASRNAVVADAAVNRAAVFAWKRSGWNTAIKGEPYGRGSRKNDRGSNCWTRGAERRARLFARTRG